MVIKVVKQPNNNVKMAVQAFQVEIDRELWDVELDSELWRVDIDKELWVTPEK